MIDLALLSPKSPPSAEITASAFPAINASAAVLARSRRPATLTYTSAVVDTLHKLGGLPWYAFGWKKESEVLEISMFEGVEFLRGWKNVPDKVYVVVEADEKMQFYDVVVKVVARFGGLRYVGRSRGRNFGREQKLIVSAATSSTTTASSLSWSSLQLSS